VVVIVIPKLTMLVELKDIYIIMHFLLQVKNIMWMFLLIKNSSNNLPSAIQILETKFISKELFYLLRNYTFEMWIIEVDLISIVHASPTQWCNIISKNQMVASCLHFIWNYKSKIICCNVIKNWRHNFQRVILFRFFSKP